MPSWHDTDFYTGPDCMSVGVSVFLATIFGIALFPGLFAYAVLSALAARKQIRHALDVETGASRRELRPGMTVVRGVVQGDLESPPVVRVQIQQQGRQYTVKSGVRHKWTETSREVEARPFSLRLDSGAVIHVEPGEQVFLVDDLFVVPHDHTIGRSRVAELRVGANVYVEGVLFPPAQSGGAYRGGEAAFTMRPRSGSSLLISREPLEKRHQLRASVHTKWAVGLAVALVFVDWLCLGSYFRGLVTGRIEEGRITDVVTWTVSGKHGPVRHWGVVAAIGAEAQPSGRVEVSPAEYTEAKAMKDRGVVPTAPFVVVPGSDKVWIGQEATAPAFAGILLFMAAFGVPFAYFVYTMHHRPWYERKKVIDDGAGPLGATDALV
jgi:hypothetical protein